MVLHFFYFTIFCLLGICHFEFIHVLTEMPLYVDIV